MELSAKRWHLAFDPGGNHLMNAHITLVQVMQVGTFVATSVVTMAMRAVHQEKMMPLSSVTG